ncbi:MAG: tRNA pseudouridine(55) synthase TruB [Halanaerobiales bacterium]|nr:tRNA pseudouridine(55) synthase TruB [Halanaerobiales bacterium]
MSNQPAILNVLKPPGMTSFDVVGYIKRVLNIQKCGHTGTLDPAAAGVLPVCINKGTKIIPFLPEEEKEYIALVELGVITDTLDIDGEILKEDDNWKLLRKEEIINTINNFKGEYQQKPPIYSAIKKNGKRLYHYARNDENVEIKKRKIEIKDIEILNIDLPIIKIKVKCSRGTYIRSLARDIGKKLNTNSYLKNLLRTKSGPFNLKDTILLDEISEKNLNNITISIDEPFDYRKMKVKDYAFKYAINGTKLLEKNFKDWPSDLEVGEKLLIYGKGQFISISKVKLNEEDEIYIQPLRVFYNGGLK